MSDTINFRCRACGHTFSRSYGVDINGHAVLYCRRCGLPHRVDFSAGWSPLPDCSCGGTYDADALGCCPRCGNSLTNEDKKQ